MKTNGYAFSVGNVGNVGNVRFLHPMNQQLGA